MRLVFKEARHVKLKRLVYGEGARNRIFVILLGMHDDNHAVAGQVADRNPADVRRDEATIACGMILLVIVAVHHNAIPAVHKRHITRFEAHRETASTHMRKRRTEHVLTARRRADIFHVFFFGVVEAMPVAAVAGEKVLGIVVAIAGRLYPIDNDTYSCCKVS